jgi:excisionase family DNA binding protein
MGFWRVSACGRRFVVLITVGEAASRVGRSPETVRRWIRSGRAASRDRGRLLRISAALG